MDLRTYLSQAPRGAGAAIARALGVHPVMVSQWAAGAKPVPDERAPALEAATEFRVTCEESCPGRWVRVPAEGWPNGKPLRDNAPALVEQRVSDVPWPEGQADRRQGERRADGAPAPQVG